MRPYRNQLRPVVVGGYYPTFFPPKAPYLSPICNLSDEVPISLWSGERRNGSKLSIPNLLHDLAGLCISLLPRIRIPLRMTKELFLADFVGGVKGLAVMGELTAAGTAGDDAERAFGELL